MTRNTLSRLAVLATLAISGTAAQAADWQFLPALNDPSYKPDLALAVTGSRVIPGTGPNANALGLELSMYCGLIQTPDRRLRTHVNLSRSDKHGTEVTAFELSPRYTVPLSQGLSVGVGPSLAVFGVSTPASDKSLFGIGVAAGVNYRVGMLYTGFDVRYHSTIDRGTVDHDPVTLAAKVGINF